MLWSEIMLDIIFNLLNSLRFILCPSMWSISENISLVAEKKKCVFCCVGMECLVDIKSNWPFALIKTTVALMILCLNDFSFDVIGVLKLPTIFIVGFPGGTSGKEPTCQFRRQNKCGFDPWFGKIPWRKKWEPTPVFLPGESHGPRSMVGYSPWGCRIRHD